jgi:hypothetical protein
VKKNTFSLLSPYVINKQHNFLLEISLLPRSEPAGSASRRALRQIISHAKDGE